MTSASWGAFERAAQRLAAAGRIRLHGRVSYLATIRRDGSPRVHPVTPIVATESLFLFMEPTSPKGYDLRRDPRYALHCGVEDTGGGAGEFVVRGEARLVTDPEERALAVAASTYAPAGRYILFRLDVREAQSTGYDAGPKRLTWSAEAE